ncbi:MAG TPA: RHS repeat-associated core domain-containing protein [Chloroflexota bacterium]|nr:RHS repeat-associated core domain-containing protein [Chloroflexota bacterium]
MGFTGEPQDPDNGLVYLRARSYDPAIGRFLERDSLLPDPKHPDSFNRFTYAGNNPSSNSDPSGHQGLYGLGCLICGGEFGFGGYNAMGYPGFTGGFSFPSFGMGYPGFFGGFGMGYPGFFGGFGYPPFYGGAGMSLLSFGSGNMPPSPTFAGAPAAIAPIMFGNPFDYITTCGGGGMWGLGVCGGAQIGAGGVYPQLFGGFSTPGAGLTTLMCPGDPSQGWSFGFTGALPGPANGALSFGWSQFGGWGSCIGANVGTGGVSFMGGYVGPPIDTGP